MHVFLGFFADSIFYFYVISYSVPKTRPYGIDFAFLKLTLTMKNKSSQNEVIMER